MRQGIPTGVHIVLERAGTVLLMRRKNTGFFDGLYSLPGGHVEEGESLRAAAVREMREETGLDLSQAEWENLGVIHRRSDSNRIDFFLRPRWWQGEPVINEPDKCDALTWARPSELTAETVGYIRAALFAGRAPWILEWGWERAGQGRYELSWQCTSQYIVMECGFPVRAWTGKMASATGEQDEWMFNDDRLLKPVVPWVCGACW